MNFEAINEDYKYHVYVLSRSLQRV